MSQIRRQASSASSLSQRPSSPSRPTSKKQKRHASVYDAVAGRLTSHGFLPSNPHIPSTRDTASSSTIPLPPDEVLFQSRGAPVRFEENDIYWADRHLRPDQQLPESDLLKALHAYASEYYGKNLGEEAEISYGSLDGSALLALGVLMEESAKDCLGETGDLAFLEGEKVDDENQRGESFNLNGSNAHKSRVALPASRSEASSSAAGMRADQPESRKRKRRKITHEKEDAGEDAG